MQNRGRLYVGLLLVLTGLFFFKVNLADLILHLGWDRLWPGFLVLAALAFYLPIFIWWGKRRALSGLAMPGTILLANALILFYNTLSGDWAAWAYLWALEPVAVGLGLFAIWLFGPHHPGLLAGAAFVGAIGLVLFVIFGAFLGAIVPRVVAPFVLIGLGLLLLLRAWRKRPSPTSNPL